MKRELSTSVHKVSSNYKSTQEGQASGPPVEPSTDPAAGHQQPSLPWSPPETGPGQLGPVITSSERYYKAGVLFELQKFGRPKEERYEQMSLADALVGWSPDKDQEKWSEFMEGIAPTTGLDKALSAIQILLDRAGYDDGTYKGNLPARKGIWDKHFGQKADQIFLAFTWPEYLELYGLKRNTKGNFSNGQEERAKEDLLYYTRPRRQILERKRYVNGKEQYDVIAFEAPLLDMIEGYQGLSAQELQEVRAGARLERTNRIVISPSQMFLEMLKTFHTYKPVHLHQQIEDLVASKKGKRAHLPRSYSLFIEYLHTVDFAVWDKEQDSHAAIRAEHRIKRDTLVDKLLLSKYREQRKLKQAYQQIDECLEIAQELGYILACEEDALGLITMQLNPEKLSRVKAKQERIAARQERPQVPKKQTA